MDGILVPLVGGVTIGLASSFLLLATGKIAGISGIFAGTFLPGGGAERTWRAAFLAGLVTSGLLLALWMPGALGEGLEAPPALVAAAGVMVGFGSRLGCGCTSGHGICGIGRLSPRSLAATATFMTTAILTVFVVRHVLGGL
ncbi:MAG: YeeE/YedE family protein [Pseudomonadota bacterium]|nr:MAG: YeeE/YedE family protein [Pseudomonadota bacterium]